MSCKVGLSFVHIAHLLSVDDALHFPLYVLLKFFVASQKYKSAGVFLSFWLQFFHSICTISSICWEILYLTTFLLQKFWINCLRINSSVCYLNYWSFETKFCSLFIDLLIHNLAVSGDQTFSMAAWHKMAIISKSSLKQVTHIKYIFL